MKKGRLTILGALEEGTEEYQRVFDQYNDEIQAFEQPVEQVHLLLQIRARTPKSCWVIP